MENIVTKAEAIDKKDRLIRKFTEYNVKSKQDVEAGEAVVETVDFFFSLIIEAVYK